MYELYFSIYNAWLLVNHDKKFREEFIKWMANMFTFASTIMLSVSIVTSLLPITYVGFLIAHSIWAFFAYKLKDKALLAQFLFFIPLDMIAIYIRF